MLTRELERRLAEATELAKSQRHEFVTLEHFLLCMTNSAPTSEILEACGVKVPMLRKDLKHYIRENSVSITVEQLETYGGFESWHPEFTLACHRLLQRSALQMKSAGRDQINEGAILIAMFYEQDSFAVYSMGKQGLTQFDLIQFVSHGMDVDNGLFANHENSELGSEDTKVAEKNTEEGIGSLDKFCVNLNEAAKAGKLDPLVGRQDIVDRLVQTLARRTKNNPLLIGDPGVGKTAIVEGLAQKIVSGDVPEFLQGKIIFTLDLGSLLAGTKFRGDFEGRLKSIVSEFKKNSNYILFIDEIHTLVGAGSTSGGSVDASNLLKPSLTKGEITCIGSTTHSEYRQYFEKDRALSRRFQKIDLSEPSVAETIQILKGLKTRFEEHHHVEYTDAALQSAVELSQRHIHTKLLPDKAIDVIDEAGAYFQLKKKNETNVETKLKIDDKEIEEVVAKLTGLPVASISSSERVQLKDLENKIKAQIFGQDEAIDKLVASIKLSRSGLTQTQKPIGSFLFTGPTGVGKTEVCRQLAEIMGIPLVRFDMSEYMEKHSVARLVGAPPGYVGYEQGGLLTEKVNQSPYCILLFDEMEKAHSDLNSILLQVMDAGRLTDGNGRLCDFKNVILVMTSNAGALEVSKGTIGLAEDGRSQVSMEALKKAFAPEFLNRLDGIVSFKDLSEDVLLRVMNKFINQLKMTLANKKIDLQITTDATKWLLKKGYNKAYGARPLSRIVDEQIKKVLVDDLLFGRLVDGGKVSISLESDSLSFEITENKPATVS